MFQYGSTTYGLYSVKEDPTAVPHDENRAEYMTGVEVYRGETPVSWWSLECRWILLAIQRGRNHGRYRYILCEQ